MLININSEHPNQIEANLPVHRYSSNLSDRIVRQSAPLILGPVTSWIASLAQLKICALQEDIHTERLNHGAIYFGMCRSVELVVKKS